MKLLTKTTLYFLIAMIPLLAAGGFFLFHQFSKEINQRVDRELIHEEIQWIEYVESATWNGGNFILQTPDILIYPVRQPVTEFPSISDTYGYRAKDDVQIPLRQLTHVVSINGTPYLITIRRSQEQKTALVANVTWIMLLVFIGLFIVTLIFNWIISKSLWQPFRSSLQKVRNIELQKLENIHFEQTDTAEFNELNASLNTMTQKIYSDYVNMKEFTENAAHEMQTPLAVVQSKMELLLQDSNLNESQVEAILQTTTALSRLSKLVQSLLLLAKIENNQYETTKSLSLADTTKKYLELFDELIKDKDITIDTSFTGNFMINLHPLLADSLVSNLLGNAIKYNKAGGNINISISDQEYSISNTSDLPKIDPQYLFKRFKKPANSPESSTGLGLSIVKKIIDTHHLTISYEAEHGIHRFCIKRR
ncbi:HAMP domain-containing histidine kinase [Chitinophagaceae bacterium LB-8]|uniref:histidine kinase n=1 Tax=Paraflavisolibacter caeni TaxID=2982496 RepID=A0A9X2XYJ4_9BACT|nr:ATP-binding protein [Paraflavisolibacter caeni]MCU7551741.1 HAMP domain-containing histidine kinase [Paraflavisolibacter caeni]